MTNIGKYSPYKGNIFRYKQPFKADSKEKYREKVAELPKKRNSCPNCGSTDNYSNKFPKATKFYAIEEVPGEGAHTEGSGYGSIGNAIREDSDHDQDSIGGHLVDYKY
ncbi:hypothetical protein O181_110176 [Austropuccinia psidii MF-1]|uniref:Uncharacterized protein n=1 Tax=Austropuccinia psidii MF-1 TaxID=1389203 RepID=A0A9Q3JYN6_9BASI|nr:hypothetical protein [Austropuccinia psidii MF-1]